MNSIKSRLKNQTAFLLKIGDSLQELGVPILGDISGEGRLEGGDVVWIDERSVAVTAPTTKVFGS